MPPVAIAAAVAAGAGAAFAGVTIATAVAIASVAFSVTAALTMKTPSFDSYASPQERKQVLRSAAAPKLAVYGEVMGSGVLFFAEEEPGEQDQDELLHMCIAIAGHEITSIGQVYLNDEPIESYGQYASYELHNNRQTADPYLLARCPSWDSTMIGKNIAFVRVTLKFNADKFPNGIPNIKMVKRGYKVYDPRTGKTAWSANSALVYLHFLKTFCGVADSDVFVEQFKSCANICDELVATAAGSGFRYRTHGEFDFNESRVNVMEAILLSCAGDRVYTGGKHGLMVGAYQGPATLELHSRQFCGDVQITPETSERDRFNTYCGKFINASQNFIQSDFPPVSVAEWVAEDGREITKDIDFRFVTDEYQAQRICAMKMRRSRVGRILQVPMNYSGFSYRPGMNIKVFIPELAIEGVEYRVDSWSFSVQGGVKLILIQDNAQMYGDIPGQAVFQPPLTNLPSSGPPAPSNLRYTARPVGDIVQGLLSWDNFGNQVADNVVNIYRGGVLQYSVRTPANECIISGLAVGTYEARVRAIAANGVGSPISTLSFTIAVPAAPTSITFIPDNWSLQLIPNFSNQLSFGTICEFFYSEVNIPIGQVEATAFKLGMGTTLMHSGLTPNTTYYYWVRSVNAYGKSAFFAASGKTSYNAASILDVLDGEIGAEHLREELRQPIEQIPDIVGQLEQVDRELTDLSETVAPIAERVPVIDRELTVIDRELTGLGSALTALDERATQTESLLRDEQDSLGEMGIGTVLEQDKLHGKIDRVQSEVGDLRDAVFTVNPDTGEIEMGAVRALRDETQASFTEVNQTLDAVTGTLATKADQAVVDAQGERLTGAEQTLDGINATLTQTVTKSEFTSEQQRLTEVSNSLDATKGELAQKAAQSTVTEQGERLAAAEQRIIVNSDAQSALAQSVSGLKAELEAEDQTLQANITEVARVSTEADQVLAQRVTGVEVRTDTAEGAIRALEEIVESDSVVTAGRFDEITATLDLTAKAADQAAEAAIANALAGDTGEQRHRQAEASIRRDQQVQLDLHQALAREVTELDARFEGEKADTAANFTDVREVIADADQANAQQITQLRAEYQAADLQTNAAVAAEVRARSDADSALAEQLSTLDAEFKGAEQALAASIDEVSRVSAEANQSLSEQLSQVKATAESAGTAAAGAQISANQAKEDAAAAAGIADGKGKVIIQSAAPAVEDQLAQNLWIDTTSGTNTPKRWSGSAWVAVTDKVAIDAAQAAAAAQASADQAAQGVARNTAAINDEVKARADADSAMAQRIDQVQATAGEQAATITGLAKTVGDNQQASALALQQLDTKTNQTNAAVGTLAEALSEQGKALAGRQDDLAAEVDLAALASIGNTLADDQDEGRARKARAAITRRQDTQADEQQALARELTQFRAEFAGEAASTAAELTEVREVIAGVEQSTAHQITQLKTEYQEGDRQTNAALEESTRTLSDAGQAMAERVTQLQAALEQEDQALNAAIQQNQQAQVAGDQALAEQIDQLQTASGEQSAGLTNLAKVVTDGQQATGEALQQLNTKTDQTNASVGSLSEAVSEQGKALSGKQDDLVAELDLAALASLGNTLADEEGETRNRKARAQITQRQEAQANEQQALAKEVTQFRADFAGEQAATSAALTGVREVIAGVEQSTARELSQLKTDYQAADLQTNAALEESKRTLSAADQAMAERVTQLQATLEGEDQKLDAAILETQRTQAAGDSALAEQLTQLQAQVTEGDQTLNAAILQTQQAQVEGDQANANSIATVQANLNNTNAAVQSGATATANLRGEVEAGWYTKANINGEGGGFGLSVKMNADGTVLSSFVIDADVFAVLSRAGGVATKRHPFIVKNGTVYMNHAMMDTAEIGSVIAKYIDVQHLIGTLIEGGSFRGGDLWIGENANGSFGAYGKRWNAGIDSSGRIYGSNVYFESGTFQGNVLALSGTMNNVTIKENCDVRGTIYAERIVGDVAAIKSLYMQEPRNPFSMFFNVAAANFSRGVIVTGINIKAEGYNYGSGGAPTQVTRTCTAVFYMNGVEFGRESVSATGESRKDSATASATVTLPAGVRGRFQVSILGDVSVSLVGAVALVFKYSSATFE